jgi:hypothetical protein
MDKRLITFSYLSLLLLNLLFDLQHNMKYLASRKSFLFALVAQHGSSATRGKKAKLRTSTHDFLRLADKFDSRPPGQEKILHLHRCGLGAKRITFDADCNALAVRDIL